LKHNYRFFLGRNIPNSHFSVSISEVKLFIKQFDFVTGYSMLHGEGMYQGVEEEFTQLNIFEITEEQSIQISKAYKIRFQQIEVIRHQILIDIEKD
jgi:hypothetical protein